MTDLLKTIRRSSAIVVMMLMFCLASQAQNITVKGHVVDSKGEEVIGASVLIKGSKGVGTITDIDGNFVLQGLQRIQRFSSPMWACSRRR